MKYVIRRADGWFCTGFNNTEARPEFNPEQGRAKTFDSFGEADFYRINYVKSHTCQSIRLTDNNESPSASEAIRSLNRILLVTLDRATKIAEEGDNEDTNILSIVGAGGSVRELLRQSLTYLDAIDAAAEAFR